jgi:hypothetical protein
MGDETRGRKRETGGDGRYNEGDETSGTRANKHLCTETNKYNYLLGKLFIDYSKKYSKSKNWFSLDFLRLPFMFLNS